MIKVESGSCSCFIRQSAGRLVLIFALLFHAVSGNAAPSITGIEGTFASGSSLTISGIGFGVKSPAQPRLWDDFEGHLVGTPIGDPVVGVYTRTGSSLYTDQQCYRGQRCAHSRVSQESAGAGLVSNWIPLEARDSFASMKVKIISAYGTIAPHNIKLLRLNAHVPDDDATHGYPNYNLGKERNALSIHGIINHGALEQIYFGPQAPLPNPSGWNSVSNWDHMSDPDTANGWVGYTFGPVRTESAHDKITRLSKDGHLGGIRSAFFCGYISRDGYDVDLYLDDLYADTNFARLEAQASGGNYEMQLPTSWSQSSISFVANTGLYSPGAQVQLVVYDANGDASAPFTLEVGRTYSADSVAPGAPGNLRRSEN